MILETRRGGRVELRTTFGDLGIGRDRGTAVAANIPVTSVSARGVPAIGQAVRIAAEAVGSLQLAVWRGDGLQRERAESVWQHRLVTGQPNPVQTNYGFWENTEESVSYRGNGFIWMSTDPKSGRVVEWWSLHPDQVLPDMQGGQIVYRVYVGPGYLDPVGKGQYGVYTVGPETMLHIRGSGGGGLLVAPNPVQVYRESLGTMLAKIQHEGRVYGSGTNVGLAVMTAASNPEQLEKIADIIRKKYSGHANAGATMVLPKDTTVEQIGLTMADAQFVEAMGVDVEQAARIMNVSVSLLGGGASGDGKPLSPEHEAKRWWTYGLGPRVARLEAALDAHPRLFGPGAKVHPGFIRDQVVTADLIDEDAIDHQRVQDGRIMIDEWRIPRGLPPLPNGVGMIPQITPVGGAPNPNLPSQVDPPEEG